MLTAEAIQSAIPLAQDMLARGITIMPVENTPLAALVKESIPLGIYPTQINEPGVDISNQSANSVNLSSVAFNVECNTNAEQPGTGIIPHDMVLDEVVPIIADSVRRSVAHARTIVVPMVDDLANRVKKTMEETTPSSLLGVEISVFNPPAPLLNSVFENSIAKYAETSYDAGASLSFALPELDEDALRKLIETNASGLDKEIEEWLAELPAAFLHNVWVEFFMLQKTSSLHAYLTQEKSGLGRANADLDRLLAIHLLARNLFDNPPEGTGANLSVFNDKMAEIRNVTGARLYFENQGYYNDVGKSRLLVRSIVGSKVIVNGEIYKRWIEEGGNNEVLFGNMLSARPVRDVDSINAMKDQYLAAWKRHCAIVSSTESNRRFVRLKDMFFVAFRAMLIEDTEENLNREAILAAARQQLEVARNSDFDCLYTFALKLICRSRFPQTDAEEILTTINRVAKENPNIEIREAAAVAVIEYVANWMASQFMATGETWSQSARPVTMQVA